MRAPELDVSVTSVFKLKHEKVCGESTTIAFVGEYYLRTKIVLDTKSIEEVPHFRSLVYDITCDVDLNVDHTLAKCQPKCGAIHPAL